MVGTWAIGVLALGCGPGRVGDGEGTATSSTGDDPTTGNPPQVSVLEQCDAPAPCDPIARDPGSNEEEVDPALECAVRQAIYAMLEGAVAELSASYCDIGCVGTDVLLSGSNSAYLQNWSTTDVTSFEEIQRCTLQGPPFFEACQGQPWGTNACTSFSDWVTNCEIVDAVDCP
ncbi:MAG: hypothetical protein IAG13_33555 [Deltaproteobacteria bacterium]|nr:hypothetical protein [Nannocystaceae bacterium]